MFLQIKNNVNTFLAIRVNIGVPNTIDLIVIA